MVPLPEKLLSVPPVALTSVEMKLVDDSLSVNVIVAVSDALRLDTLLVTAMVGTVVSTLPLAKFVSEWVSTGVATVEAMVPANELATTSMPSVSASPACTV